MRWASEIRRFAALTAVVVAAGVGITWLVLPPVPEKAAPRPPPPLRIAGALVSTTGDVVANALDLVRRYATGELTLVLPDGTTKALKRAALGVELDRVRLADFIRDALTEGGAVRRVHERKAPGTPVDVPLPLTVDASVAIPKLLELKQALDASATDAVVDLDTRKLKPEKVGYRLDVYGTLSRIDAALREGKDKVDAEVEIIEPKLRTKELGDVKFSEVLGYFETHYNPGGKGKERTYNLRLAASRLDGAVVMPGAIFDFNAVVGPRDEAHGYRVAPVIAQGELVDGLGGGTCQISGTLHGAVFFAGLDVVERYPHSRPSYYIKLGLDATVVYPTINFRFRNPFTFPIVLHETVANGLVRAEILGPERKRTVTFFRRIDEVVPFEEIERPSPKLPEGTRVLAQRGIPGFKTTSSRVVREGAYAVRTHWSDSYPPTMQIVSVGAGPKDTEAKLVDDQHPEYVVDEYLTITQGPDIRTPGATSAEPGGGTVEAREPGRTGGYGWTEKAGLSKFKGKPGSEKGDDAGQAEGENTPAKVVAKKDDAPEGDKGTKKKKRKKKGGAGAM